MSLVLYKAESDTSGLAPPNERRASTPKSWWRTPSSFYTEMVNGVRKRGLSGCVSSQPVAEQPLIAHSPKYSPAPCLHPRPLHASFYGNRRYPRCYPPHAVRVPAATKHAVALPLHTMSIVTAITLLYARMHALTPSRHPRHACWSFRCLC
jgi:hypothetical protein